MVVVPLRMTSSEVGEKGCDYTLYQRSYFYPFMATAMVQSFNTSTFYVETFYFNIFMLSAEGSLEPQMMGVCF